METNSIFDPLAALLAYPGGDYHDRVTRAARALAAADGEAAVHLAHFAEAVASFSTEALQELFIQTFDMNPDRSLEVGWHLFGENYDRGTFLVKMRRQLRRFGIPESGELPDHITHVLAVLGCMPAAEAEEFACACVFPALEKMRKGFRASYESNPYKRVFDALAGALRSRFGDALLETVAATPSLRVLEESPECLSCAPAVPEGELP